MVAEFNDVTLNKITVMVDDIELTADKDWADDFELMAWIGEMDTKGNPLVVPYIVERLAGSKAEAVIESLRSPDGRVRLSDVQRWILRFFDASNAKN